MEHHQAHLASRYFVSPFERAALLSADGLGDFASSMWGSGDGNRMRIDGSIAFPHSLGLYYSAVTQYLGFLKFGDEYKVMGLAAYGEPKYMEAFRDIVRFSANGGEFGFVWDWITSPTTEPGRKCPGQTRTRLPSSAKCFRMPCRRNWAHRRASPMNRSSNGIAISPLRCKRGLKRSIWAC